MRSVASNEVSWLRPLWLGLLIAASAALTAVYTCITPFAAFAVIATTTLPWGHALAGTVVVWLANQAIGFGVLNYPWTAKTLTWGVAIGAAALIATLAAHWTIRRLDGLRSPIRTVAGFISAFALYQSALYAVAVSMLGGTGAFALRIVGQVLLVNAVALVGLYGLHEVLVKVVALRQGHRLRAMPERLA